MGGYLRIFPRSMGLRLKLLSWISKGNSETTSPCSMSRSGGCSVSPTANFLLSLLLPHVHPSGFLWNSQARAERAELGNILGDFSFEAMRRQAKHHEHVGMMEQPEDLGKTRYERIPQHQPASTWQFPPFELALREGMRTCVFSQLDCGSESVKPTLASTEASRPPTWNHVRRQANFQLRRLLCWATASERGCRSHWTAPRQLPHCGRCSMAGCPV